MPRPMKKRRPQLPPNLTIEQLLEKKTIAELLEDGDLYTPEDAAPHMGYTRNHVHRLCREASIERVEQGKRYYLYARTVHGVFKHAAPSAKR